MILSTSVRNHSALATGLLSTYVFGITWSTSSSPILQSCSPSTVLVQKQNQANLDLEHISSERGSFIGFADNGNVILVLWGSRTGKTGQIARWNLAAKKVAVQRPLSLWLDSDLRLSWDGRTLATRNVRENKAFKKVKTYRVTVLSSSTLKTRFIKNIPGNEDVVGFLSLEEDEHHIIALGLKAVPVGGGDFTFGHDQLQWINTTNGRVEKRMPYAPARECDQLKLSPDKKYLLGFFYSEAFDPYGESDYAPLRDQLERHGFVDVINPKTGKILWHLAGTDKQPVGDPFFFISPTRFVSSDTLFDIATHKARHWSAVTPTRRCLAAVPNHPNHALFLTPNGLQLRNWQKNKTLVSWPNIKKMGRILFSPDLKMFSFKRGSLIQFWKFDPKWLR